MKEDDAALQLFPARMGQQMQAEIIAHRICTLPVFAYLRHSHGNVFVSVCSSAMGSRIFAADEDLFVAAEIARFLYIVVAGDLTYLSRKDNVVVNVQFSRYSLVPENLRSSRSSGSSADSFPLSTDGALNVAQKLRSANRFVAKV